MSHPATEDELAIAHHEAALGRTTRLWIVLAAMMITSAVVAEIVSVKLFQVRFYAFLGLDTAFTLTCGALLWPLVFLTTDTINEFFGAKAVRFVTWVTMGMISWMFVVVNLSILVPAADFSPVADDVFQFVFGQSAWIVVGSMAAFLLSQIVDVTVFHVIRRLLKGRHIWARATGSTIVSQLIDSFVVIYIAFWGPTWFGMKGVTASEALEISLSSFAYKVGVAIALTPLIYVGHWMVHRWLGDEVANALAREAAATS
ncbi:MAG: queuosine precursor transporter [Myxococcales bacterium]|nr:queuosine precursor transporter [Myxococcales bacterium]